MYNHLGYQQILCKRSYQHFANRYWKEFGYVSSYKNIQRYFQIQDEYDEEGQLRKKIRISMKCPSYPFSHQTIPPLFISIAFQHFSPELLVAKQWMQQNELWLPLDVNRYIAEFMPLTDELTVTFKILYPITFPTGGVRFTLDGCEKVIPGHPMWSFHSLATNINMSRYLLQRYFKYKAKMHNEMHSLHPNWTPAYGLRKDILIFFERINHFEEIIALQGQYE